jgi:hypothetical protein
LSEVAIILTLIAQSAIVYLLVSMNHRLATAAVEVQQVKAVLATSTRDAAVEADEVKVALAASTEAGDAKLDNLAKVAAETQKTTENVHTLVNSAMSNQLKIAAVALRRVAELTKHPDDVAAADLAEQSYHDHEKKQAIIDRGGTIAPNPPETGRPPP